MDSTFIVNANDYTIISNMGISYSHNILLSIPQYNTSEYEGGLFYNIWITSNGLVLANKYGINNETAIFIDEYKISIVEAVKLIFNFSFVSC